MVRFLTIKPIFAMLVLASATGCTTPTPPGNDSGTTDTAEAGNTDIPLLDTTPEAAGPVCTGCLTTTLQFGPNGGFDAGSILQNTITACKQFTHYRRYYSGTDPDVLCQRDLGGCNSSNPINIGTIETALAQPQVVAALAAGTTLFGVDRRGTDSTVFEISYNNGRILVGDPCDQSSPSGCTNPPAAVQNLVTLLNGLVTQEQQLCAASDGGG